MRLKHLLTILTILLIAASPALGGTGLSGPGTAASPTAHLSVRVAGGLVTMEAVGVEIGLVLKELSRSAGIALDLGEGLAGPVTMHLAGVPLEEAFRRLCANRAVVYRYDPETRSFRILQVAAYGAIATEDDENPTKGPLPGRAQGAIGQEESRDSKASPGDNTPGEARVPASLGKSHGKAAPRTTDHRGRPLYKEGALLVTVKKGVSEDAIDALHASMGNMVKRKIARFRLHHVLLRDGLGEDEAMERYTASGLVERAGRNALRYPLRVEPNDTNYSKQWGLEKIRAPEAWGITTGNPDVVVAVIDTGFDLTHPDLSGNIWTNTAEAQGVDEIDDDGNDFLDDLYGWDFGGNDNDPTYNEGDDHGTHVAGIIAARGNNGLGVAGTAWNVKVMLLKVADSGGDMLESYIIDAIDYAITNGARVVNCSFGGDTSEPDELTAFTALREAGILAMCAAGNDGVNLDRSDNNNFPAEYDLDNIVAVAASDQNDRLASYSDYGAETVDVMAPGSYIYSTVPSGTSTTASVTVNSESPPYTSYEAIGMLFAGVTDTEGITGTLFYCGEGYTEEFPSGVDGGIALIQRSPSEPGFYFSEKAANAMDAGAVAAIIFDNRVDEEFDTNGGTLQTPGDWIPVVSMAQAEGEALSAACALGDVNVTVANVPTGTPYGYLTGTSMAAPVVSGIAALIYSVFPDIDYTAVKAAILNTVDIKDPIDPTSPSKQILSGGRVNALNALYGVDPPPGDFTCDLAVGLDDVIIALRVAAAMSVEICPAYETLGSDANGDGLIGIEDAICLLQSLVSGP